MAIKVNNVTAIDDSRNVSAAGIATVGSGNSTITINGLTGIMSVGTGITMQGIPGNISIAGTLTAAGVNIPISVTSFNPISGATGVALSSNIVITFNQKILVGTGNITLRTGSSGGTVIQTISAASASISGAVLTIDPSSNFNFSQNVFVVIDAGVFKNSFDNTNKLIDTYDFTALALNLGDSYEGGFLICKASPVRWVVSPSSAEVTRTWYVRSDANTSAQSVSGCTGWFVPSIEQMQNPGFTCKTYWPSPAPTGNYWSDTNCGYFYTIGRAWRISMDNGVAYCIAGKTNLLKVRSFRCVSY